MRVITRTCLLTASVLIFVTYVWAQYNSAQDRTHDPLAELKRLSRGTKTSLSVSTAHNIASELARPISSDTSVVQAVAQLLTNEQLEWKDGRKAGIKEDKLLRSLNRRLELDKAPDYLQFREADLRKIRVNLWIHVPDLTNGIDRKDAKKGLQVVGPVLSPFEAYLASGLLAYQKLYNDDFVRTTAEETERRRQGALETPKKFGLLVLKPNKRREEFRERFYVVARKWSSTDALVNAMSDILKESRND